MDDAGEPDHAGVMDGTGFSGDEVWGVLALRALLAGDLRTAAGMLGRVRPRYCAGFLARLAVLMPSVAIRMACRPPPNASIDQVWGSAHRPPLAGRGCSDRPRRAAAFPISSREGGLAAASRTGLRIGDTGLQLGCRPSFRSLDERGDSPA